MERMFYCALQQQADSKIQSSTDKCVSLPPTKCDVRRLLPASDYCRALLVVPKLCSAIWLLRSAVVGSWVEPPNIWLTVAKNAFVGWAFNLRVRMLLTGAVTSFFLSFLSVFFLVWHQMENLWKSKKLQSPKAALFIRVHTRSRFTFKCLLKFIIVVKSPNYPERKHKIRTF